MAAKGLGINEHHHAQVINYMRFSRYQRSQRLKAIELCFQDVKDTRVVEETYTVDEVNDILDALLSLVKSDMEDELDYTSRTNVLLLRQVFQQAEKWHLKLQADISELENREMLESVKEFEESELAGRGDFSGGALSHRLEPMNDSTGAASLLQLKINELEADNQTLRDKIRQIETKAIDGQREKSELQRQIVEKNSQLKDSRSSQAKGATDAEMEALRRQLASMQTELQTARQQQRSSGRDAELEADVAAAKHELLRVQETLELAEKELDRKVHQTTPYKNLKSMMEKKNAQIKELRQRLSKYEEPSE